MLGIYLAPPFRDKLQSTSYTVRTASIPVFLPHLDTTCLSSNMMGRNVFIVGPGLIGWNVLDLLIADGYNVSGLVRRESHGEQIKSSGATPIQGDLNDHDLIVEHVIKNDVS
jgi:hypothetical protein